MATSFESRAATDHRAKDAPGQTELFLAGELPLPDPTEHRKAIADLHKRGARKRRIPLPFPDLGDTQRSWIPQPAENDETWTDTDIVRFHWKNLVSHLRSLTDGRASEEMRAVVIEWIARPLVPEAELADYPMSFQTSCFICGWDPRIARRRALKRFAPEKVTPRSARTS